MPKVVDPDARRRAVAEAVFRVVHRHGVQHASLRNVAEEAGLAIGSVRHYFADHDTLLAFAMRTLGESIGARWWRHATKLLSAGDAADPRTVVLDLLAALLPLDEQRREETAVWLAFVVAARTNERLRPHARELPDIRRKLVRRALTEARRRGRLADWLDLGLETERLCALLDGLTTGAALHPEPAEAATVLAVLRRHLDALTAG